MQSQRTPDVRVKTLKSWGLGTLFLCPLYQNNAYIIPTSFGAINAGDVCTQKFYSVVSWCTKVPGHSFIEKTKTRWTLCPRVRLFRREAKTGQEEYQERNLDERGMTGWSLARSDPDLPGPERLTSCTRPVNKKPSASEVSSWITRLTRDLGYLTSRSLPKMLALLQFVHVSVSCKQRKLLTICSSTFPLQQCVNCLVWQTRPVTSAKIPGQLRFQVTVKDDGNLTGRNFKCREIFGYKEDLCSNKKTSNDTAIKSWKSFCLIVY